ncbi:MAG: hypothetical protein IKZ29_09305 [Clostridiales bacterium]|nr:hypothetical protein [Clostridiales bacterium]
MKITPTKDYKKPLYALGLATAMMAVAVTGCTDPDSKTKTRRRHHRTKHTEVQLAGDTQTVEPDIDYAGEETVEIPSTTEDDIRLAGDVQICPDYTVEDDLTDDDTNTLGEQGLGDGTVSTGET